VNNVRALFLIVAICGVQAASAQSLPDRVRGCAAQSDAGARLQCYDQVAASLERSGASGAGAAGAGASATGGAPVTAGSAGANAAAMGAAGAGTPGTAGALSGAGANDAAAASPGTAASPPPSPEAQFGISGGRLERKKEAVTPKEIQAVVSGVARRPRGELVITLDNGQVWVQLEPQAYYPLEAGETVRISKGVLGSYLLTTPAKRGSKVTRIL
jgi:hypothetical protein